MEITPTITINGTPQPLPQPVTLTKLLEDIGLAGKPVVVELNATAIFPRDYPATTVEPGAKLEIVTLAAGG